MLDDSIIRIKCCCVVFLIIVWPIKNIGVLFVLTIPRYFYAYNFAINVIRWPWITLYVIFFTMAVKLWCRNCNWSLGWTSASYVNTPSSPLKRPLIVKVWLSRVTTISYSVTVFGLSIFCCKILSSDIDFFLLSAFSITIKIKKHME